MKRFVIDTNVLINDPQCMFKFGDNEVLLPILVLQELDNLKKRGDSAGQSARQASRNLDDLREVGKLHDGVPLKSGGTLRVIRDVPAPDFIMHSGQSQNDHSILQTCLNEKDVILITEDINMRIMADALDIEVERYQNSMVRANNLYDECQVVEVRTRDIDSLYENAAVELEISDNQKFFENEYVMLTDNLSNKAMACYYGGSTFVLVKELTSFGLKPRNKEQSFAMDALLDSNIPLVVLAGPAGTGKTLLAIAAGLEQVVERQAYSKMTICRPVVPVGRDIGFLPGSAEEKLDPWLGPIYDSIECLIPSKKNVPINPQEYFKDKGYLQVLPITYIRGRSLPNQYIVVDEAQNLTQHEAKTILTRVGKNTKIVFTGDPYQIDSPYLDQSNNGMSYIIDKFRGHGMFAHVALHKGERSPIAELAAQIM